MSLGLLTLTKVNGHFGLWSDDKVKDEEIPQGFFKYDIRGADDDGEPCNIEKHVAVNYCGTILLPEELTFPEGQDWIEIDEDGLWLTGIMITPEMLADGNPVVVKEILNQHFGAGEQ